MIFALSSKVTWIERGKKMEQTKHEYSMNWAGRTLTVEIGQLTKQANGAVMVRYGDTAVLSTATASKEPKNLDFFSVNM
jgi:polyribonucleotide nucleotidyltransferase